MNLADIKRRARVAEANLILLTMIALLCVGGWWVWPTGMLDAPIGQLTLWQLLRAVASLIFWAYPAAVLFFIVFRFN